MLTGRRKRWQRNAGFETNRGDRSAIRAERKPAALVGIGAGPPRSPTRRETEWALPRIGRDRSITHGEQPRAGEGPAACGRAAVQRHRVPAFRPESRYLILRDRAWIYPFLRDLVRHAQAADLLKSIASESGSDGLASSQACKLFISWRLRFWAAKSWNTESRRAGK